MWSRLQGPISIFWNVKRLEIWLKKLFLYKFPCWISFYIFNFWKAPFWIIFCRLALALFSLFYRMDYCGLSHRCKQKFIIKIIISSLKHGNLNFTLNFVIIAILLRQRFFMTSTLICYLQSIFKWISFQQNRICSKKGCMRNDWKHARITSKKIIPEIGLEHLHQRRWMRRLGFLKIKWKYKFF